MEQLDFADWQALKAAEQVLDADGAALVKATGLQEQQVKPASSIPPKGPVDDPEALYFDPFTLLENLGYRERYSPITYDTLENMAYQLPIYPGILQTRLNQVTSFAHPQEDVNQTGYHLVMRERGKAASKKDKIRMANIEDWLQYCGAPGSLSQDGFVTFIKKITRDSLVYDQACFETRCNANGNPVYFHPVDAKTIRLADAEWIDNPYKRDGQVRYVQVYDETVTAEFTPKQLCFGVRNPRTDLRLNGYGFSELEMGVHLVTALLFAFHYNSKFFSQGTVAKGMLNVPEVPQKKLNIFSQQWRMVTSGILNAWRTPIVNFKDAQWIKLYESNRDMEFNAFMDWLIKTFCAVCGMDPEEINFTYGNQGQQSQMFQAPAETKVKHSKDKGLLPLLGSLADWINRWIIWRIDPTYRFEFTGLNPREAGQVADVEKKQVTYLKTVNEIRAENDLEPLPEGQGDVILDPQWMQNYQAQQMQEQGMDGGGFGEEQPEEGGEDEGEEPPPDEAEKSTTPTLKKARVTETRTPEVVRYEVEL